jgi:hypothetical protein
MADATSRDGAMDRRNFLVGSATAVAAGALAPEALGRQVPARAAQDGGVTLKPGFEKQTYLLLRDHHLDDGTVPSAIYNFNHWVPNFWASPAIALIGPNGTPIAVTSVGENDRIEVTVQNRGGVAANGVKVEAFVSGPITNPTPLTSHSLGSVTVDVGAVGQALAPAFPWTPTPSFVGHNCLFARVALGSDTYPNPNVFKIEGDRHAAQRNIEVVALTDTRRPDVPVDFRFLITNPGPEPRTFELRSRERRLGRRALRRLRLPIPDVGPARRPLKTRLAVRRLPERWDATRDDNPRLGIVRAGDEVGRPERRRFLQAPDEHLIGTISLYRDGGRGAHVIDIAQMPVRGKRFTGGLTLVVVS